ncbi:MAG: permease-like cell division protein FtsX [Acidobacteriota bacterium]
MTLLQALLYFTREAALNLVRGWKVSLLAIFTIAVSLFLTGVFLIVGTNLETLVEEWRGESKIVIYLEPGMDEVGERIADQLGPQPWAREIEQIAPSVAAERFRRAFPSLADLLEGWGDEPLPASLEITVDWQRVTGDQLQQDLDRIREDPAVTMVDDDRDWLRQLETAVLLLRGLTMVVGGVLLVTAIFTISSVIRLTAYLYEDEIAVMRLVGATEFFIRGPFYLEGLLQGLAGGAVAVSLLATGYGAMRARVATALGDLLTRDFLDLPQLVGLVALGGLAGLVGAVASLRREALGQTAEERAGWVAP